MDTRIKQLELEAITYADSKVPAMDRYNDIYHSIVRGRFAELVIKDSIQTLRNNGYDDAAECLHDVHFGMDDPV